MGDDIFSQFLFFIHLYVIHVICFDILLDLIIRWDILNQEPPDQYVYLQSLYLCACLYILCVVVNPYCFQQFTVIWYFSRIFVYINCECSPFVEIKAPKQLKVEAGSEANSIFLRWENPGCAATGYISRYQIQYCKVQKDDMCFGTTGKWNVSQIRSGVKHW